jgi:hypothetical protein
VITPKFQRLRSFPEELRESLFGLPVFRRQEPLRVVPRRTRRTERSTVYQIEISSLSSTDTYWVKVHTRGHGHARKEYELLTDLRCRLSHLSEAIAVEAVACLDEHDALITRHAAGTHLSSLLRNGFCPSLFSRATARRRARECYIAGVWLGHLHGLDRIASSPEDVSRALSTLGEVLERDEHRWRLPAQLRDQVGAATRRLIGQVGPGDLEPVRSHGDYGTHNILRGDKRLVILDPSFRVGALEVGCYRSRFHDLTRFWSTIQGNTRANLGSPVRAELLRSFLVGYEKATGLSVTPSQPAFRLFALRQLVISLRDWPNLVGWALPSTRTGTLRSWMKLQDLLVEG